ncbi:MAG: lipopolysaccharide biosynthesis protein [Clostridia bacterium]|nr:lipopolysaccharide biosynthesis protein [Clostridia bacterium]NCD02758.1 lipopolysaccharide biosynthesis protein [Clostridia bacterium]
MDSSKNENVKQLVIKGLAWKLSERLGVQGVQFVIQVVLARLLAPEIFGSVAIINVFILVANVLVQYGFSTALIQKIRPDSLDYSSVCYINIVISSLMYGVIYFGSPYVAEFYHDAGLVALFRAQALILFPGAVTGVQNAILSKKMDFKKSFMINVGAIVLQGITGIVMAVQGYGIWSLVISQIVNAISMMCLGFIFIKWYPKREFSLKRTRSMFSFGKNILCASLLETIFNNIYSLAIGKAFSKEVLGYYNRGQSIPSMLMNTVNGSIQGVLFPALANSQDNKRQVKIMMRRAVKISSYIIFPIMLFIIAAANGIIEILLTDKWLPAVPFLQMSCLTMAVYPIHTANLQAISAIGRSDIYLKLELIKKTMLVITLIITLPMGIDAVVVGSVLCSWLSILINAAPNKKLLKYSILEQFRDIFPSLAISIVMAVIVYFEGRFLKIGILPELVIQFITGGVIYILSSIVGRLDELDYLIITAKRFVGKGL